MSKHLIIRIFIYAGFIIAVLLGLTGQWESGQLVLNHFVAFSWELVKMLALVFILIGLFDVWVPRDMIENHLGDAKNAIAYLWALLLAMTTVGGLFVALPIAQSLEGKGASKPVVLTYLTGATIVRLPMTIFEITFIGIKFTTVRWTIAIILTILTSFLLSYMTKDEKLFTNQ